MKFRQKQTCDDLKENIHPLLKRFVARSFGFRRLTSNVPMRFIFFIEEGRLSEGYHSHCVFSVPQKWSGFDLDPSYSPFIKRENEVRRNVQSALKRFKYSPVNPLTGQIDREMKKRDWKMDSLISNESEQNINKIRELYSRPLTEVELREMVKKSREPRPLISPDGFDLRRIFSLNGLTDYHLKELWKNNDCFDERNSDRSAT